jgi:hypothetical protein
MPKKMEIADISANTILLVKTSDLELFAEKLASEILAGQPKPQPARPQTEKPISQPEAVRFLGKSRQTLIAWRKKGLIKAYQLGGRIYYKPSELVAALANAGE